MHAIVKITYPGLPHAYEIQDMLLFGFYQMKVDLLRGWEGLQGKSGWGHDLMLPKDAHG